MIMPLSVAIRLGAMMKPQYYGSYFSDDHGASCAIGAAFDAIGRPGAVQDWTVGGVEHWDRLTDRLKKLPCPECNRIQSQEIIPHLNDDHRWTRERIADYVELHETPLPEAESQNVREIGYVGQ